MSGQPIKRIDRPNGSQIISFGRDAGHITNLPDGSRHWTSDSPTTLDNMKRVPLPGNWIIEQAFEEGAKKFDLKKLNMDI
ncbi:MAG: hypothetical protein ACTSQE_10920 [Candidatus Heimdallarchaeaceae archaeon]